jgi:hypothetical protein
MVEGRCGERIWRFEPGFDRLSPNGIGGVYTLESKPL